MNLGRDMQYYEVGGMKKNQLGFHLQMRDSADRKSEEEESFADADMYDDFELQPMQKVHPISSWYGREAEYSPNSGTIVDDATRIYSKPHPHTADKTKPFGEEYRARHSSNSNSNSHSNSHSHSQYQVGGMNPAASPPHYWTDRTPKALHEAVMRGDDAAAQWLLDNNVDPNGSTAFEETPLMIAVQHGNEPVVKSLLMKGAEVNSADRRNSNTALHFAALFGNRNLAKLLLRMGASTGAVNRQGRTPAQQAQDSKMIELLQSYEDRFDTSPTDSDLSSPMPGLHSSVFRATNHSSSLAGSHGSRPTAVLPLPHHDPNDSFSSISSGSSTGTLFENSNEPFLDKAVKQARAHGVNNAELAEITQLMVDRPGRGRDRHQRSGAEPCSTSSLSEESIRQFLATREPSVQSAASGMSRMKLEKEFGSERVQKSQAWLDGTVHASPSMGSIHVPTYDSEAAGRHPPQLSPSSPPNDLNHAWRRVQMLSSRVWAPGDPQPPGMPLTRVRTLNTLGSGGLVRHSSVDSSATAAYRGDSHGRLRGRLGSRGASGRGSPVAVVVQQPCPRPPEGFVPHIPRKPSLPRAGSSAAAQFKEEGRFMSSPSNQIGDDDDLFQFQPPRRMKSFNDLKGGQGGSSPHRAEVEKALEASYSPMKPTRPLTARSPRHSTHRDRETMDQLPDRAFMVGTPPRSSALPTAPTRPRQQFVPQAPHTPRSSAPYSLTRAAMAGAEIRSVLPRRVMSSSEAETEAEEDRVAAAATTTTARDEEASVAEAAAAAADVSSIREDWQAAALKGGCVVCSEGDCHGECVPGMAGKKKEASSSEVKFEQAKSGSMVWTRGELLGEGAYGKVYAGLNQSTGELMAVKQLKLAENDEKNERMSALEREISIYRTMRHKHIVGYIGMERDELSGSLYIFLEFASGGSIHSMLERFGKFSQPLVQVYTRQLLLGLEYLHSCKIIHRDIKGGNVLVDSDGVIKLADFGASKVFHDATMTDGWKSIRGSVFWMAPEVIKQNGYGRKADIWSVGCTVIEMLTGTHPWPAMDNTWAAIFQIAKTTTGPPIPDDCSNDAKDFLGRCFQLEAKDRPSACELLQHPFVASVSDTPKESRMMDQGAV